MEFRQRFLREAQAAGRLNHPGIVTVHDAGVDPSTGLSFMAMEFIEGRSLKELVKGGHTFTFSEVARIGAALAGGLDYAHSKGVVHRDIKPANIILTSQGAGEDHRLRRGAPGVLEPDGDRPVHRHAQLHVAGAGDRRGGRRPQRPLLPRRGAVRAAHRHAAVRRRSRSPRSPTRSSTSRRPSRRRPGRACRRPSTRSCSSCWRRTRQSATRAATTWRGPSMRCAASWRVCPATTPVVVTVATAGHRAAARRPRPASWPRPPRPGPPSSMAPPVRTEVAAQTRAATAAGCPSIWRQPIAMRWVAILLAGAVAHARARGGAAGHESRPGTLERSAAGEPERRHRAARGLRQASSALPSGPLPGGPRCPGGGLEGGSLQPVRSCAQARGRAPADRWTVISPAVWPGPRRCARRGGPCTRLAGLERHRSASRKR